MGWRKEAVTQGTTIFVFSRLITVIQDMGLEECIEVCLLCADGTGEIGLARDDKKAVWEG